MNCIADIETACGGEFEIVPFKVVELFRQNDSHVNVECGCCVSCCSLYNRIRTHVFQPRRKVANSVQVIHPYHMRLDRECVPRPARTALARRGKALSLEGRAANVTASVCWSFPLHPTNQRPLWVPWVKAPRSGQMNARLRCSAFGSAACTENPQGLPPPIGAEPDS